jgi:ribosomal protein S7
MVLTPSYREGLYKSQYLSMFINQCGFSGKQEKSEVFVYRSFFFLKKKLKLCPLFIFFEVLEKVKPLFGVKLYKRYHAQTVASNATPYILSRTERYKKAIF